MLLTRRTGDGRMRRGARLADGASGPDASGLAETASAEAAYPNRVIRMIVPYPAGGTTDFLGRLVAEQLQSGLGAAVVVENKPRRRYHARRRPGGPGPAGRLHAVDGDLDHARHQQDALQEAALRSGEGFHADRAGRRRAVRADRQSGGTGRRRWPNSSPMPNRSRDWPMARPAMAVRSISAPRCCDRRPTSISVTWRIAAACRRCST